MKKRTPTVFHEKSMAWERPASLNVTYHEWVACAHWTIERSDPRRLLYNNKAAQAPTPLLQCETVEGGARSYSHESRVIVLVIAEEVLEEEK